jgi:hypothetical protein
MLGVPAELRQKVRLLLDKTLEREYGNVATPEEGIQAGIETGLMYYNIIAEEVAGKRIKDNFRRGQRVLLCIASELDVLDRPLGRPAAARICRRPAAGSVSGNM